MNDKTKTTIVYLLLVVAGLFVVGFAQGYVFGLIYGEQAFDDLYIREFTEDKRHVQSLPCPIKNCINTWT